MAFCLVLSLLRRWVKDLKYGSGSGISKNKNPMQTDSVSMKKKKGNFWRCLSFFQSQVSWSQISTLGTSDLASKWLATIFKEKENSRTSFKRYFWIFEAAYAIFDLLHVALKKCVYSMWHLCDIYVFSSNRPFLVSAFFMLISKMFLKRQILLHPI